jgi:hypothetical protein
MELAQEFLLDLYKKSIIIESGIASKNFEEAVAVSEDGLRIVKADYVAVVDDSLRITIWGHNHFAGENKVNLSTKRDRIEIDVQDFPKPFESRRNNDAWIKLIMVAKREIKGGYDQCFVEVDIIQPSGEGIVERVFITRSEFCRSIPTQDGHTRSLV